MRILMLNYEFPPLGGGAANANYYLLKEFSKIKDLEIDLVTSSKSEYKEEQFSENIRIFRLDVGKKDVHYWKMSEILRWSFKAYKLSKKLIKQKNYDLSHCWFGWPGGVIGYLNRKKLPYIVALRGSDVPGYNLRLALLDRLFFSKLSRLVWGKAEKVIANSEGLKKLALKTKNCGIEIIYNGVDTKEFKPGKNKNEKLKLISTGRLIERKGYIYLLEAIKELDVELVLVGEGNKEKELKNFAKDMDKVKFVGAVKHSKLPELYSQADIFVLPSLNEGMSNTILEAMASGLPIITTDTGGTKELIKENGIIVEMRNSEAIKKAIREYLKNPELIKKHGLKSRQIAEGFSWSKVAEKYYKLYEEILKIVVKKNKKEVHYGSE